MVEQGHRKPPKGYKNIDIALSSLKKLEGSVKECDQDAPAHTLSTARWLENAAVNKEIDDEYYGEFMARIKTQTRIFADKCNCKNIHPDSRIDTTDKEKQLKLSTDKIDKIDWEALDKYWKKEYEEDYGPLAGKKTIISEYP
jgi:hypothetical protein